MRTVKFKEKNFNIMDQSQGSTFECAGLGKNFEENLGPKAGKVKEGC